VLNLRPKAWALIPVPEASIPPAFEVFRCCVAIAQTAYDIRNDLFEGALRPAADGDSPFVTQETVNV
jgi:hypothetical protein